MKFTSLFAAALTLVAVSVSADPSVDGLPALSKHPLSVQRRHAMMAKKMVVRRSTNGSKKSCRSKTSNAAAGKQHKYKSHSSSRASTSTKHSTSTKSSPASAQTSSKSSAGSGSGSKAKDDPKVDDTTTKSASSSASRTSSSVKSTSTSSSSGTTSGAGLIGLSIGACGSSGATEAIPNGSESFLNCGVTSGGWNPPNIKMSQLKVLSGSAAVASSVFAPCQSMLWAFQAAEKAYNIPATVLMSFAMQESTCNPSATGGNGEQGLMQITPDKCGGAPNGNCKDVAFNVDTGAKYFRTTLDEYGGNVLLAIGQYNGWQKGLTIASATAAKAQGHCYAQNNLDYLYQMLNGWFLGKNNVESLGIYHNLASCN